jgi:2-keto-4-pentenoate hydratase/2-oxohepta-3-ene-1,7-dioic acid hydratase in catechol pathway
MFSPDTLCVMRIARFSIGSTVAYGIVEGAGADAVSSDPAEANIRPIKSMPFGEVEPTDSTFPLSTVTLLAPVLPSKIIGIGRNYADHIAEMGSPLPTAPLMFLKPSTSVIGPADTIKLPELSERVEFEGELAVVIGTMCRQIDPEDAHRVIGGYTCANDVTARDLQAQDEQWSRAKGFDTFCPLGPWIETDLSPESLTLTTSVNGDAKQAASTSELIFGVPELVSHVSSVMTLLPGDVILTGTPAGVAPLHDEDQVAVSISGIGTLTNEVLLGE